MVLWCPATGFGRCGVCPARSCAPPCCAQDCLLLQVNTISDLPSWATRSAQQGVDPSGGYSQMTRRAEQLGPQKLLSQVTRRAATARAVLPSGATRPAFRQSKWKAGISRHPAHTGSDGHGEPSPLSKPAGPSRLPPVPLLPAALVRRENGRRQEAGARLRWRPGRGACPRDFLITATNGSVTLRSAG
jgi:hypothetical protein